MSLVREFNPSFPCSRACFLHARLPGFLFENALKFKGKGSEGKHGAGEWLAEHKIIMTSKY